MFVNDYFCLRKPAELLDIKSVIRDKIPVVRRFTGGGTVIVDSGTVFVTFICNKDDVPTVQPYPRPIMSWSGQFYTQVFGGGVADFHLRENGRYMSLTSDTDALCFCTSTKY